MTAARGILLVEDDSSHAALALRALERCEGVEVEVVESISEARLALVRRPVDLVLADLRLPDGSGLDLLDQPTPVIVQTSQGDETRAVAAMKGGALDYCVKSPEMYRDLPIIVERALNASRNLFERRRMEVSLRESDERFRQLAASIPEVFWLFDLESSMVIYASPAWESVYGTTAHTWEGRMSFVHADDCHELRQTTPSESQLFRIVEGNKVRWIEERRFAILDERGNPCRLSCLALDVTRRRELEESLRHAQKMHAIGRLAGGVAHDFNNMLAAILSSAQELSATGADAELCDLIVSASLRASELTRNLLAYSRRGKVEKSPIDVNATIREAIALLERSIDPAIRLTTKFEHPTSRTLGDAAQLQSAFLNLGINARDALPRGGEICFSTREVLIDGADCAASGFELRPGRYLEISVSDTGEGIPPDTLPRIFDPFFTTKSPDRGTGLGLAAVYGTILDHKGSIAVHSTLGVGTTFTLCFPIVEHEKASITPPRPVPVAGRGLVLLVDDEPLVLETGRRILQRLGYEVTTAVDGEDAWRIFREMQKKLVAVVSDLSMPKLGGRDLVKRIKAVDSAFPCVLCTGYASDGEEDFPVPLLAKPYGKTELAQSLAEVVPTEGTAG